MDVSLILKIAGVGILVAVCAQVLQKSGKDEQAMLVSVGGLIVVMLMLVGEIGELIDTIRKIFGL
jgi:stage III sporulation protein AC